MINFARAVVFLTSCFHFFVFCKRVIILLYFCLVKYFFLEMFCKKVILSTSQNSSENTCVGVLSFSEVAEYGSSPPELFLGKGVPKIYSKFTGEHPWESVISKKLIWNFIEIALRHRYSPVNLLYIFRALFSQNTSKRLLLRIETCL